MYLIASRLYMNHDVGLCLATLKHLVCFLIIPWCTCAKGIWYSWFVCVSVCLSVTPVSRSLVVSSMLCGLVIVWMSLGEPHIDHDNGSHMQNNSIYVSIYLHVSISLSIYHLPAFVTPWFPRSVYALKWSMYSSILKCSCA